MIEVGSRAPSFGGRDQKGAELRSETLLGRGPIVLYFYPRDFTPGCTREACLFRDAFDELQGLGASIVGVSVDDGESHRRFAERHGLPFSLLSDPDRAIARAYGIVRPLGLGARRVTFVIDRGGIVRGAFHSELSMSAHLKGVRATLGALAPG